MAQVTSRHNKSKEVSPLRPETRLPELGPREAKAIETHSRPNAALIHETIRAEGESELDRSTMALLLSGSAAGLSMGFSFLTQALLHARLPDAPWRELVEGFGYTIGFLIVILGRQQLFTENTLTPILPLLHNREPRILGNVLRLWSAVFTANMLGALVFAFVMAKSGLFDGPDMGSLVDISRKVIVDPFMTMLARAVFAGWLIALTVWLLPGSGSASPIIIVIITYLITLGGFAHIIAGAVEVFFLIAMGERGWGEAVIGFFLPVLIGNILGGVTLVALLNYGQVARELEER